MAVSGVSSSSQPNIIDKDKIGFNGLSSDTFMKLLITQLQNQDPTQPVGNDELLQQLATMRNLQSNIELSETLKAVGAVSKFSAGAAFLGKEITGIDIAGQEISGVADRMFVRNGEFHLGIGDREMAVGGIITVGQPQAA